MLENFAALPLSVLSGLGGILGLLIGSFLNVVVFRYPVMMFHQWTVQSRDWLKLNIEESGEPPTLSKPASHCGHCKTPIKAWQNIPLISWLALGGKCASCKTEISVRYPLVELLTGVLSAVVVYKFGWSLQSVFGLLLTWVLVTVSFVDFDHKILPDDFIFPTLWLGLALSVIPVFASPTEAIIGAITGYLTFWLVFQAFLLLTGKEGMGHGDFKLMSLLGAWFGWLYLPQIVMISTILGSIVGVGLIIAKKADGKMAIPFGPYIAIAGWIAMLWGDEINRSYLRLSGI